MKAVSFVVFLLASTVSSAQMTRTQVANSQALEELKEEEQVAAVPVRPAFGLTSTLINSVGLGTFLSGYNHSPSATTTLVFLPRYDLPKWSSLPNLVLSGYFVLSSSWFPNYYTSVFTSNNRLLYSDVTLSLDAPRVVEFEKWGIQLSPGLNLSIPTSFLSRSLGRWVGLGVGANVRWSKKDFSIAGSTAFTGWIYGNSAMALPCSDIKEGRGFPPILNPDNPSFDLDQYLQGLMIYNDGSRGDDGRCITVGRQTLGQLMNTISLGWTPQPHSLNLSLVWYLSFLRNINDKPELTASYASHQNFTEATMGKITYAYTLPLSFDMSVGGGVMSSQASYDKQGRPTFPFFDFITPGKNQTQFFVQMTMGI